MQVVWASGGSTAEAVREQLVRHLKESTVRTVLRRLEQKGYVTHTVEGRTFVYRPVDTKRNVAVRAAKQLVELSAFWDTALDSFKRYVEKDG